ncbi:MAG: hypothetical protein OXC15_04825 [Rhodospirillaceae bacterium]|nr:hypothetical protein [Rhodospirillaceae bacterium]
MSGLGRTTRPAGDPAIATIQRRVAARYNVRSIDLRSARRARDIAWPRHVAIHLSRELTAHSLPAIGRMFGDRDHTSIAYACRRVAARMARDPEEAAVIRSLALAIAAALPDPETDGVRNASLDDLARLLERRKVLKARREEIDREIGQVECQIDLLGHEAWGAKDEVPAAPPQEALP